LDFENATKGKQLVAFGGNSWRNGKAKGRTKWKK
jgi:hypothetical protein